MLLVVLKFQIYHVLGCRVIIDYRWLVLLVEFLLDGEQFLVQKKDRLVLASLEPAEQRFALGYPRWGITKKLVLAALLTGSEPP